MNKLNIELSTNNLMLYHFLQRFVYQYFTLFSVNKDHPALRELTNRWYYNLFYNEYFSNIPQTHIVSYEILDNKNLDINVVTPLYSVIFKIDLNKDIYNCVTLIDNDNTIENLNIFNIDYKF